MRYFIHTINNRAQVIRARAVLGEIRLVTTDEVLTELLDGLAQRGTHLREVATRTVRKILADPRVTVHPQSRESFLAGLRLYERRDDKAYSLVDCISMTTMRRQRISEVLTNLTFALPVSFPAVRGRILNAVNAGSGEKAWVKTLPLV